MKIRVCSDLHLEFSDVEIKNDNNIDVLVLAGDILNASDLHEHKTTADEVIDLYAKRKLSAQRYRNFLNRASNDFEHVVVIAGNHEFYNGKFHAGLKYLKEEYDTYKNIHFLENATFEYKDVTFIGATLWTDCNRQDHMTMYSLSDLMNDYVCIRNDHNEFKKLKPIDTVKRHNHSLKYFREVLVNNRVKNNKIIVVSHHAPSYMSVHEYYKDEYLMNGGYFTELSEFILDHPEIKYWFHGHTHHPFDYMIGDTRVICNPRGYESHSVSENTGWNPDLELEI